MRVPVEVAKFSYHLGVLTGMLLNPRVVEWLLTKKLSANDIGTLKTRLAQFSRQIFYTPQDLKDVGTALEKINSED